MFNLKINIMNDLQIIENNEKKRRNPFKSGGINLSVGPFKYYCGDEKTSGMRIRTIESDHKTLTAYDLVD